MESIAMRKVGSRLHDGKFGPHRLRYQAQVDETVVALEAGPGALAAEARIVSFSYTVLDQAPSNRPLLFAFNGGPGSASLWLHLGFLGPKRLADADSTTPRQVPPFRLVDNPDSPLDVADIVLIDPPGRVIVAWRTNSAPTSGTGWTLTPKPCCSSSRFGAARTTASTRPSFCWEKVTADYGRPLWPGWPLAAP